MTNGGPAGSSSSPIHYIYSVAIVRMEFGYASAVAIMLFAVIVVLTIAPGCCCASGRDGGRSGPRHASSPVPRKPGMEPVDVPIWLLGTLVVLVWAAPFVWMVSTSFKFPGDVMTHEIEWFPRRATIDNYIRVFEYPVVRWGINSIVQAVVSTSLCVVSARWPATPSPGSGFGARRDLRRVPRLADESR